MSYKKVKIIIFKIFIFILFSPLLSMAEDTIPPSSPTNFAFIGCRNILTWNAPTLNADGTPLDDLAGYIVYYGTSSGNYSQGISVGNVTTFTVDNLNDDLTYYFAATAYDISGNQSGYSNEVSKIMLSSQQYTLDIHKNGTGGGNVTAYPAGIDCGSYFTKGYCKGKIVTLTAMPDANSVFDGWSGGGCLGKGQCVLTINSNMIITATFNASERETVIPSIEEKALPPILHKEEVSPGETKREKKEKSPQSQEPSEVKFSVQVGVFSNVHNAIGLLTMLYEKGYNAYITISESKNNEKLYKVCVGNFSDRERAESLSKKIKKTEGLETFVTSW
jgi:hypothetical protein